MKSKKVTLRRKIFPSKNHKRIVKKNIYTKDTYKLIKKASEDILNKYAKKNSDNWIFDYISETRNKVFARDFDLIEKYVTKGWTVVDIGSAPFVIPLAFHTKWYKSIAIDINPWRFVEAEKLPFHTIKHNADTHDEKMPIEEESVDLVIFTEIFEHLRGNLIKSMEDVYRILKKGGVLFLGTPNLRSIKGIMNFLFRWVCYSASESLFHEWSKIEKIGHMWHVREYTEHEIVTFLERIWFKVEVVYFWGSFSPSNHFIMKIFNVLAKLNKWRKPGMTVIARKN